MKKLLSVIILIFCFSIFAYTDNIEAKKYLHSGNNKFNSGDSKGAIEDYNKAINEAFSG